MDGLDKKVILVVDDDVSVLALIKAYLMKDNISVVTAYNGEEALQKIKDKKPDIIILDIMMPVMDGYKCALIIKNTQEYKDIPIIFLTALRQKEDRDKAYSCGASAYITKPVSRESLLAVIKKHWSTVI